MIFKHLRRSAAILLVLGITSGTLGQIFDSSALDNDNAVVVEDACKCGGSIAATVVITTLIVLFLTSLGWCYLTRIRKKNTVKPDPESANRAAYDNPQFQGDDHDSPDGANQARKVQTTDAKVDAAKVASTATNTTSTLDRGKNTLERVINAVIRGSRSTLDKKTKDDHNSGSKQIVTVALQGHDFTGLGFTIHGNITQGLYVKEVMNRGPASQSGQIVPGDKVVGITVLTDHIVYEDALAILSYASPYPVIINLEKGCGPLSGFSSLNSKSKLNTSSSSSVALIHPSFKTQSCGDLNKIKTIDVSCLKFGNIVPMAHKGKFSSVNVVQELTRIQKMNYVQRNNSDRHSERAIDVPGADIQIKSTEVKLDIDSNATEDTLELTNVQVHRPMSPSVSADTTHTMIEMPQFEDSKLSEAKEKLGVNADVRVKGPKFGVKVFPDMTFLKKKNNIDMETGEVEIKQARLEAKVDIDYGQETTEKKKSIASLSPGIDIKNSRNNDSTGISLGLKGNDEESDAKNGLNVKSFSKNLDVAIKPGNIDVDLGNVENTLPSLEINLNKRDDEPDIQLAPKDRKDVKPKKKSKSSFKMPDINLPSFGIKSGAKHESEASISGEDEDKHKSKSKSFKFGLPTFDLGLKDTKTTESDVKVKASLESQPTMEKELEKESTDLSKTDKKYDLKMKIPGFNLPSFNLRSKDKQPVNLSGQNEMNEKVSNEPPINLNLKASIELDSDVPLDKGAQLKTNLNVDALDSKLKELDETKSSVSDVEDINQQSLNIKLKSKKNIDTIEDNENKIIKKKSSSKGGFKIEAPDINLSSFGLKKRKSKDYNVEENASSPERNEQEIIIKTSSHDAEKSCPIAEVYLPDVNIESNIIKDNLEDKEAIVKLPDVDSCLGKEECQKRDSNEDKYSKKEKKKSKEKSGFNFKFKGTDFSFPNFGNKSLNKEMKVEDETLLPDNDTKSNIEEQTKDLLKEDMKTVEATVNIPDMPELNKESDIAENELEAALEIDVNIENTVEAIMDASVFTPDIVKILDSNITEKKKIEVSAPEIDAKLNLDTNVSKNNIMNVIDISTPSINVPEFKLTSSDIDPENFLDIDVKEFTALEGVEGTEKTELNLEYSIPSFSIPYDIQTNEDRSNINIESSIPVPDEIKVETNQREMGSIEFQTTSKGASLEHAEILSKDMKIPQISSPDLGFEDDKSKNGKHDREECSDYEISIKLPDISQPKWSVKSNSSYEDSSTSKNVSLDSNLPDIDLLDDESSEDLNITDAIKKKRFGIKIHTPELVVPDFLKASLAMDEGDKVLIDGNQSDEMKSFKLKLRSPIGMEGATALINEPEIDYDIEDAGVKLPRVKVSSMMTNVAIDEIGDRADTELLGNTQKNFKFNKSDEWKMKGVNINIDPISNDTPEDERDNKFNIDIDDADFVIPDIKSIPGYDINNLPDFDLFDSQNIQASAGSTVEYSLPEFDIKERRKIFEEAAIKSEEKSEIMITKKDYLPDFQIDIAKSKFLNLSLESSELESDLPEADSDLKRATSNISEIDVITEASLKKEQLDSSNSFGNAFGFRGFKKHIEREEIQGREQYSLSKEEDISENSHRQLSEKDLPEVDIHFDMQEKLDAVAKDIVFTNESRQEMNFRRFGIGINSKSSGVKENFLDSEHTTEVISPNLLTISSSTELKNEFQNEPIDGDEKDIEDEEKGKPKSKVGIGFGFKAFGKSSDNEDNDVIDKVSNEPEGTNQEVKDKIRPKAKKTFSFKGLVGRVSSDTEEENSAKISENPMVDESEEKVKLRNKSSLTFGFKQRSNRNSDSEENLDSEKVENNPLADGASKKQKIKSNLTFGFINKTKTEADVIQQHEASVSLKTIFPKEPYENKSESEGGEDERPSMESKIEEGRGKSKYGLHFGFRKGNQKTSSDSDGVENDENQINLDERGASDKNKEQKGKSIKLGFKGLKSLKGKIQNEFNKMRHESPSSDEDEKNYEHVHGEKRKKLPKKKDKEKKFKHESETYMDTSEEAVITSAGLVAKEIRRKRANSKNSSSSSSSSNSSSDDEEKLVEKKKKKKTKSKRKEDNRFIETDITENDLPKRDGIVMEVAQDRLTYSERAIDVELPISKIQSSDKDHDKNETTDYTIKKDVIIKQHKDIQSTPRRYVVVREMKLKKSQIRPDSEEVHVHEAIKNVICDKKNLQSVLVEDKSALPNSGTDTDGANWGSDSDMDKITDGVNSSEASVNLVINKNHRHLTDSEELKRKAASLGDLSTLHEGAGIGSLLERAVSLDFKNASVGHPSLHIRRLQLPDSSATSIDEADEPQSSSSPKKLDSNFGLKAASQWGTLEEALRLGIHSDEHLSTTFVRNTSVEQGAPVSNIEISGDPTVTTLSVVKNNWNESFEDDCPPSLPMSPVPVAPTTISVKEKVVTNIKETVTTDSSIVVVGSDEIERANNIHNINIIDDHLNDDSSMVTITMVPAESHINIVSPPVSKLKQSLTTTSSPPEVTGYNNNEDASIVTISHDKMYENGEILSESSDHNISDEFIAPESGPQNSMTQITLEGDGGYTVTEGTMMRTVILTNPNVESSVLVETDRREVSIPR